MKKGITLVETVVAMALIAIFSAIGYAVINWSILSNRNNQIKSYFILESQNYAKIYAISKQNEDEYLSGLKLVTGQDFAQKDVTIYYDGSLKISNEAEHQYSVKLTYGTDNFLIECSNKSGKEIYRVEV